MHVFDHHCNWLNNCVGVANYRPFLGLVVSAWLMCALKLGAGTYQILRGLLSPERERRVEVSRYGGGIPLTGRGSSCVVLLCPASWGGCAWIPGEGSQRSFLRFAIQSRSRTMLWAHSRIWSAHPRLILFISASYLQATLLHSWRVLALHLRMSAHYHQALALMSKCQGVWLWLKRDRYPLN